MEDLKKKIFWLTSKSSHILLVVLDWKNMSQQNSTSPKDLKKVFYYSRPPKTPPAWTGLEKGVIAKLRQLKRPEEGLLSQQTTNHSTSHKKTGERSQKTWKRQFSLRHRRPANVIADLNLFHKRVGGEGKDFPSIENLKKTLEVDFHKLNQA